MSNNIASFAVQVLKVVFCCIFQACTLARRTAETFLKYVHRNVHTLGMQVTCSPESQVKGQYPLQSE